MLETLIDIDTQLLLWINGHHAAWSDTLMWYSSQAWVWIPMYLLLAAYLIWLLRPQRFTAEVQSATSKPPVCDALLRWLPAVSAVLVVAAAAGLSDFVTSGILKGLIARPRPTHTPDIAGMLHTVNGYRGGHYGFPSSHAANCWALCLSSILILHSRQHAAHGGGGIFYRLSKYEGLNTLTVFLLLIYAMLNCYSRMYLGVHFPLDIVCGTLTGCLIGWLLFIVWQGAINIWISKNNLEK